jgi:hypothetical protein
VRRYDAIFSRPKCKILVQMFIYNSVCLLVYTRCTVKKRAFFGIIWEFHLLPIIKHFDPQILKTIHGYWARDL